MLLARSLSRCALAGALIASATSAPLTAQEPERANPIATAQPEEAPQPADTTPPIHWSKHDLKELLEAIDGSRDEGLRPADYQREAIGKSLDTETTGPDTDLLAETAARALAHDYADGRVSNRDRFDWHIDHSPAALTTLDADLDAAVKDGRLQRYLTGLLPQDARYTALRAALKDTPKGQAARIVHIRASMERWRWMPRALGADYLLVNVPAYRVTLYRGDTVVATHDVVVGAPKTPTPMINAYVGSIVVNPWWTLPPTVLAEGKHYPASKGYIYQSLDGRTVVRQKPGPDNALGRLKIDMPNPYAIYLHDTPAKAAFAKPDRALSHGCIRVKDIASLAGLIDQPDTVETALASPTTQTLQLERSLPVYIAYFTAAPDDSGKVVTYADPYARDAGLVAALDGQKRAARRS
jgi:murein L,D-transpeptidase YcbB/YkuD